MLKRIISLIILLVILSCEKHNNNPNIIFILADDLGYGDLSSYGSKTIETINIDKLADDGVKLTSYYAAQPVCSASRAAILTGAYPNRIGIYNAFGPTSDSGISHNEYTLAEMLKDNGYKTGIFGKWHLGSKKEFFPTNHGFDEFYGILYSNDMWRWHPEYPEGYPQDLLLYRNENLSYYFLIILIVTFFRFLKIDKEQIETFIQKANSDNQIQ